MKVRPIAMKCTQEQFESIKPKLEKNGIRISNMSSFEKDPFLVNNAFSDELCVCNFSSKNRNDRELFETWNEQIFLESCGIKVEETYQITKEQILKLYNNEGSKYVQEWFPSVFEEDKKELVVGKWYKGEQNILLYVTDFKDINNINGYGFIKDGSWEDRKGLHEWGLSVRCIKATPQEIQQALENEARKRYKKGDFITGLYGKKRFKLSFENTGITTSIIYVDEYYGVWMNIGNGRNEKVFNDGIWATIIKPKPMTKEQIEKELGYEISII